MLVYSSLILWCLITSYLMDHCKRNINKFTRKTIELMPMLAIFIVSGIRYNVGTDYAGTYTMLYLDLISGQELNIELFPRLIYKFIYKFDLINQWFFIITSFIFAFFSNKAIIQQSSNKCLSYFILICGNLLFIFFNQTRQFLGIIVFYWSLIFLFKDNSIKYYISNICATLFHTSCIIFIPLSFVIKRIYKLKVKLLIIVFVYFFGELIIPKFLGGWLETRYAHYFANMDQYVYININLSMIVNALLFISYELIRFKRDIKDNRDIIYGNLHFIGLIISVFCSSIPNLIRIFNAFRFIEFLSVPHLLTHVNKKYKKLLTYSVYAFYLIYFVILIGINNSQEVLPYQVFFGK